jgi:hypothetical protein
MLIRATIVSFDAVTYTATVRPDRGGAQALTGVRVSRAIPSAEMTAGRLVIIATSDHGDPADLVVLAVYA